METDCSENRKRIFGFDYIIKVDGNSYHGTSFSVSQSSKENDQVDVEYLLNDPDTSRIIGFRNAPYSIFTFLFVMIFPAIGFKVTIEAIRNTYLTLQILRSGTLVLAELTKCKDLGKENRLEYKYIVNNRKYYKAVETKKDSDYIITERIIFADFNPSKSILYKALPKKLRKRIQEIIKTEDNKV